MDEDAKECNRKLIDRFWEEIWNKGKLDVVDQLVSADLLLSLPGRELHGPAGLKEWVATIRGGFPDIHFTTEKALVDGDDVAVRWTAAGTHAGPVLGIAPTGKKITMVGITIFRIVDGKIVEEHASEDMLGLLQQLGVLPPLPPAASAPSDSVKPQPLVLMPGEGRTITARDSTLTVKVFGKDMGSAWSLSRLDVPAGFVSAAPPPHYHTREEESFYILEGTITFHIEDREVRAPAGSFVKSPRNLIHAFSNPNPVPASLLVIGSPSGLEDYLIEVYELLSQPGPVDAAKMKAVFEKYGIFITAPPLATTP
jgi:steroid delta-isomerase-like uncharacterized protein